MRSSQAQPVRPEMKEILLEASRALAHLDADRLEELALCCQSLNKSAAGAGVAGLEAMKREVQEGLRELELFGHVLDATRANLRVLRRLRELRFGQVEYTVPADEN
ncbi:MAG TPA: hypothetical protein VG893_08730 [Terracidiphilus sp.]|nr:hypothetical protein [Terracidiphilus sp.]